MGTQTEANDKTPLQHAMAARKRFSDPIRSDDPEAAEKLTARIAGLEAGRSAMRDLNAALRLKSRAKGDEKLIELGVPETQIEELRRTCDAAPIFPPYELSNLGANIKRLQGRLRSVEVEAERPAAEDIEGETYRIIENTGLNRLQIVFEGKPDADTRAALKRHGFRWAPSQNAWQRHLNNNGRYALARVRPLLDAA